MQKLNESRSKPSLTSAEPSVGNTKKVQSPTGYTTQMMNLLMQTEMGLRTHTDRRTHGQQRRTRWLLIPIHLLIKPDMKKITKGNPKIDKTML